MGRKDRQAQAGFTIGLMKKVFTIQLLCMFTKGYKVIQLPQLSLDFS